MKKIVSLLIIVLLFSLTLGINFSYATETGLDGVISGMKNASKVDSSAPDSGIIKTIITVIGLIQFAGTGIALIVITMLGIKYIIASPSEKADTKKAIMPIFIGCVLLFGAVNIVAIIADLTGVLD